jgi:LysM repeat protein
MKDDSELEINDAWPDDALSPGKGGLIGSGKDRLLRVSLAILLVLIFVGGILYFLSRGPAAGEPSSLKTKMTALEQKIAELEKQLSELQGKIGSSATDPALLQRVDALAQKVEGLEKQKRPAVESKASPPVKPAVSADKQYHTVRKGETLVRISKQYGISPGELRKLNNLPPDHQLRTGEKLLVSRR